MNLSWLQIKISKNTFRGIWHYGNSKINSLLAYFRNTRVEVSGTNLENSKDTFI